LFELVANHRRLMSLRKKFGFRKILRSGFRGGGGDVVEIYRIRG
jgi:hypothetical protein